MNVELSLLYSFNRWENWVIEMLSDLLEVTKLVWQTWDSNWSHLSSESALNLYTMHFPLFLGLENQELDVEKNLTHFMYKAQIHRVLKQVYGVSVVLKFYQGVIRKRCLKRCVITDPGRSWNKDWETLLYTIEPLLAWE